VPSKTRQSPERKVCDVGLSGWRHAAMSRRATSIAHPHLRKNKLLEITFSAFTYAHV
jgi:hypothetical protein